MEIKDTGKEKNSTAIAAIESKMGKTGSLPNELQWTINEKWQEKKTALTMATNQTEAEEQIAAALAKANPAEYWLYYRTFPWKL